MASSSISHRGQGVTLMSALALLLSLLVGVSEGVAWVPKTEVARFTKALQKDSRYSQFLALLKRDGSGFGHQPYLLYLQAVLAAGSRTVLIPTNTAFNKLSAATRAKLKSGAFQKLQSALLALTVKPRLANSQLYSLKRGAYLATASGSILVKIGNKSNPKSITLAMVGGVGKANVVVTDVYLSSALSAQAIDTFLLPPKW